MGSLHRYSVLLLLVGQAVQAAVLGCSTPSFSQILPPEASVESVAVVAEGGAYGEGPSNLGFPRIPTDLPYSCALKINVTSSNQSFYRFGLFLPATWNKRFLAVGNGGFAGGINWLDMGVGVRYGFASMSTDTGHNSTSGDISWALDNDERKKDFGFRAIHGSAVLAKQIIQQYYGTPAVYSYYSGCSTGGRQGLKEAQLYPETFDGLLIGAPAWWTSHLQTWTTWLGALNLPQDSPSHIPTTLFSVIGAEVSKQCDAVDGVRDGIISRPEKCNVQLDALLCGTPGVNLSACLTADQLLTARKIYADYIAEGKFAFPGLEISSEAQWAVLLGGKEPSALGTQYEQFFLFNDPNWPFQSYNDSIVWLADKVDPGDCSADGYDLSPFKSRGGKIIMYHGQSDGLIPTRSTTFYYEQVAKLMGGIDNLLPWFRFFLVPGLQHCSGTAVDAPWYFAGPNQAGSLGTGTFSTPGFRDSKHDSLLALMSWVENGTVVDEIVATTWTTSVRPESGTLRQRPLCPYPKISTWNGQVDINDASNWACEATVS
jgi:feruloyl esterase